MGLNLMRAAKKNQVRLIRLSTDLVFDGNPYVRDGQTVLGDYREDWPVSPVTVYGKLMAESESRILEEYPETAILRIALPMGPSLNGHAGAIDWIESRFRKGRPATLYFDEVRSNLYVQDLNHVIAKFLANDANGIFHVGGPKPLSLYQIAQVINKLGNYPPDLLMGCLRAAAGPMPPRAGNVSMNTDKLRVLLGNNVVQPWPNDRQHLPNHADWHRERIEPMPHKSVVTNLYGYGWPEAWEHPGKLLPT
jgi:dTDP-4-dehydrorhamnose reductase